MDSCSRTANQVDMIIERLSTISECNRKENSPILCYTISIQRLVVDVKSNSWDHLSDVLLYTLWTMHKERAFRMKTNFSSGDFPFPFTRLQVSCVTNCIKENFKRRRSSHPARGLGRRKCPLPNSLLPWLPKTASYAS